MDHNYWMDIRYLSVGNETQREVFQLLMNLQVLNHLQVYSPILVGTVPIGINISDLDVICEVYDYFDEFETRIEKLFSTYNGFTLTRRTVNNIQRIKANFIYECWPIEIFGQAEASPHQNGFRHMVIEARLLDLLGDQFRKKIIRLKSNGMKTEPAFAKELNLDGNPYEELLKLSSYSDEELKRMWVNQDDVA